MTTDVQNGLRVDIVEPATGIPQARVVSDGDATFGQLEAQASQALAAYRLSSLKAPFPGGMRLVETDQTGPDTFVTVFEPERLI